MTDAGHGDSPRDETVNRETHIVSAESRFMSKGPTFQLRIDIFHPKCIWDELAMAQFFGDNICAQNRNNPCDSTLVAAVLGLKVASNIPVYFTLSRFVALVFLFFRAKNDRHRKRVCIFNILFS
jgi:hypothetical protein